MDHNYRADYQNVRIRPLKKGDIENLRIWRNDSSNSRFLRRIHTITPEMQEKWYEAYLSDRDMLVFAIEETEHLKRMVGSLALYDFRGKTAEIGKIQIGDAAARGKGIGGKSFVLAMQIGFEKLGLEKIVASVHRENIAAYKSYMRIGFRVVGSHPASVGGTEDEIEIDPCRLWEANGYLDEITYGSI